MTAGFILLTVLAGIMFLVPPLQVAVSVASILIVIYFFTRPLFALFAIFTLRGILDLLWWIPGTIAGLNMLQLFSASVFILLATQLFLDLKRLQFHPCFKLLLGYLLLMTIAVLRCDDIPRNVDSIVRYTSPFILFFMVSLYFDKQKLRKSLLTIIGLIGIIPLSISLYHIASGQMNTYSLHGYSRLLGGYKNLHNMALMTLLFITIWIFWLSKARTMFHSLICLGMVGLGTLTLYKTYIRTGLLGFAIFIGVLLLMRKNYRVLAFAVAGLVAFILFSPDMQDRFGDLLLLFDSDNITLDKRKLGSGRWGIWSMSMAEFLKRPAWDLILGPGLGAQRLMTLDWVKMFHSHHITLDPHNDLLLLLYQIGPLGVMIYLGFQWKVFETALKVRKMAADDPFALHLANFVAALTVMVVCTNAVSNSFIHRTSPGWYYWCICGLLFAEYNQIIQKKMRAESVKPGELEAIGEKPKPAMA
jgi:hypothetical protein